MIHIRGSCAKRGCNCVCFCVTNFISIQIAVTQNVEEYLSADDGNMCQEGSYYTTHRAAYLFSVYIFCCLPCVCVVVEGGHGTVSKAIVSSRHND